MQVRPLRRYWKTGSDGGPARCYGNGRYLTQDLEFMIERRAGIWEIKPNPMKTSQRLFFLAGLHGNEFKRQKDAVAALEQLERCDKTISETSK